MSRRVVIQAIAEGDITDAAIWYEARQPGLGDAFLIAVRIAIAQAAERPQAFHRVRTKPEVRRVLVRRFPYRVFFVCRSDAIIVFSVLHSARRDREWKRQI